MLNNTKNALLVTRNVCRREVSIARVIRNVQRWQVSVELRRGGGGGGGVVGC